MNQKTWEKKNTIVITDYTCPNCNKTIKHHKHYTDYRFCEECNNEITADYNRKRNNPDNQEQINYFGWNTPELFLQSVYEELTNNSDSIYYE